MSSFLRDQAPRFSSEPTRPYRAWALPFDCLNTNPWMSVTYEFRSMGKRRPPQPIRCGAQRIGCGGFEIGVDDAGQQSQMLSRKRRCYTAKSFPAQQRRMLDSKVRCRPGNADATQQNRFLRSNGGCWTAKSDAVQETPMLQSKIVSCATTADAGQQSQMLSSKRRC